MKVWLLKDGETLPIEKDVTQMRTWMLAAELARRGHEVTWWSSTHSHQQKKVLSESDVDIVVDPGFRLRLLSSGAYRHSRSVSRLIHHRKLASRFARIAKGECAPDVIVASYPTIDFALSGIAVAKHHGCMSVVDVRDPWPDIAYSVHKGALLVVIKALLKRMEKQAEECLNEADVLYACSEGFLEWALKKAGRLRQAGDAVFYIGRPVATKSPTIPSEAVAGIGDEKIVLAFVGSFGHVYELELICQAAWQLLREGDTRYHFVLAGDGSKGRKVRRLASGLSNVTMTGWIKKSDTVALLRRAAVGLAPYNQLPGCLPNKVCEYLAEGLPIVSSLEGDMPGLLERYNAGYSYPIGDCSALIDCIRRATTNSQQAAALRKGANELFRSVFVASDIYRSYAQNLERLVG